MAIKKKHYDSEKQGQCDFFDNYRIDYRGDNSILVDNTDGVYHGNIMEFKLNINNTGKVLFQAIKYLSRMRIKGEPIPARILLIDLNATKVYVYNSADYIDDIQKVYVGAASKGNDAFSKNVNLVAEYDYMEQVGSQAVMDLLINKVKNPKKLYNGDPIEWYLPIDLDENCIVGWAERYYREIPKATKGDFLGDGTGKINLNGEIRDPKHFAGLINPYTEATNEKFKYLMDCLNDRLNKKDLGAFYTPVPYCQKAAELVEMAVARVPDGNDYIILDRCVDSETEYFNGHEWKKVSEYQDGEQVLQWHTDGSANLVTPLRYIDAPADEEFYHYTSGTLDMCLSASHRVVYYAPYPVKGSPLREKTAKEVFEKWEKDSNGFRGRIPITFSLNGENEINADMLRVAVMVNADGSYRPKLISLGGTHHFSRSWEHNIYEVRVYKERKIERARMLLAEANIEYREIPIDGDGGGVLFRFRFPFNPKQFPDEWIWLTDELKQIFIDELFFWDGSIGHSESLSEKTLTSYRWNSSKKHDVDIVQMIAASIGYYVRVRSDTRSNVTNYACSFRKKSVSKMTKENNSPKVLHTGSFVKEYHDRKYCFEVPSSYLILRRNNQIFITGNCAGTGNLEAALYGRYDKNGDELISHCVVSTYEYYEYKVLLERIGQDVRNIIPPTEANVVYENGKVSNADAMSKDYIDNPLIKQYVDNPNCTIILFENPPYRDSSSSDKDTGSTGKNKSYIFDEMSKHLFEFANSNVSTARDLANQFIWSGYNFYIRQDGDAYILYSPIKYWKNLGLVNKEFLGGYLFNRKHFHATNSVISCIAWGNKDSDVSSLTLEAADIIDDKYTVIKNIKISKVSGAFECWFDRRKKASDIATKVWCEGDGTETNGRKCDGRSVFNDDILAYVRPVGYDMGPLNRYLTRQIHYNARGFYLRKDNHLEKLPLWVAKMFTPDGWYETDIYATTSDGGDAYTKDKVFLKSCLIYTCLSNQNKCLSFNGSDGRYYRNELCFDTTNGATVASADLKTMVLDVEEQQLLAIWGNILAEAKKTANYNPKLTYGVYQITKELNTSHEEGTGTSKKTVYDYPNLNGYLTALRVALKAYYKSHITDKMFKYELLK